jgi:tetratricopeptide (TPR) repeat protein
LSWFKHHAYKLLLLVLILGVSLFLLIPGTYSSYFGSKRDPETVLREYRDRLEKHPYDSTTLLEAARFHYRTIRDRLQAGEPRESLNDLAREGLRHYRRLIGNPDWKLQRRDYFYASYLYYVMGSSYYERAQALALKSYNEGYRSRPLVTVLANLHYYQAESEDDYRVALNYYESLGSNVRDPVVLYNKAQTLRELGEIERGRKVLQKGEKYLEAYSDQGKLLSRYRVAKVQLSIAEKKFREALSFIETLPEKQRSLQLRTLYARCLIAVGDRNRARSELKEIVQYQESPQEAEILLRDLTSTSSNSRS